MFSLFPLFHKKHLSVTMLFVLTRYLLRGVNVQNWMMIGYNFVFCARRAVVMYVCTRKVIGYNSAVLCMMSSNSCGKESTGWLKACS